MNTATFIYILASCVLIVAFAYVDYVQSNPVVEVKLTRDFGTEEPIAEEQVIKEEVTVEDRRVTLKPPAYLLASHKPKTYAQLIKDLEHIPDPPHPFKLHVFDCSQMSAHMEYQLENRGYDTTISCSKTRGHAWVTVHNIIGRDRVDIECIPPVHVKTIHHEIEDLYNNITEALNGVYPNEWDWWCEGRVIWVE